MVKIFSRRFCGISFFLFLLMLSFAVLGVCAEDGEGQILNNVTYSADATLSRAGGPYTVIGVLTVNQNVTLTIESGAILKFQNNSYMVVNGILRAAGSQGDEVVFTSYKNDQYGGDTNGDGSATSPVAGDWNGIIFSATADGNTLLKYCIIDYAGSPVQGAVTADNSSPAIENCTIRWSLSSGIALQSSSSHISNTTISDSGTCSLSVFGGSPEFTNNSISVGDGSPIHMEADLLGELLSDNTFTNINPTSYIEVLGGIISHDATWKGGVPLKIVGSSIMVEGTDGGDAVTTLTIEEGSELRFNNNIELVVGGSSGDPGALKALGTAEKPIHFTSSQPSPVAGAWWGINFLDSADDNSILRYCIIDYAGGAAPRGAVTADNSSPAIENCTIRWSLSSGIALQSSSSHISNTTISDSGTCSLSVFGGSPEFTNNSISVGDGSPIHMEADLLGELLSDNTFTNINPTSYIEVLGGIISHDATWKGGVPLKIVGSSIMVEGTDGGDAVTTLTIEEGSELRFNNNIELVVGGSSGDPGALKALGTAEKPIHFTSSQPSPVAGAWRGIVFSGTADNGSLLSYCIVDYAGGMGLGAISIDNASLHITDSIIRHSSSNGIMVNGGSPLITNCSLTEITLNGIHNMQSNNVINAENNWWGDATGPLDASDDTASGGLYNPGGLGTAVSDYVDYEPWLGLVPKPPQNGDLNNDGVVSLVDSILGLQVLAGFDQTVSLRGDVNGDGLIGLEEVIYIINKMAEE